MVEIGDKDFWAAGFYEGYRAALIKMSKLGMFSQIVDISDLLKGIEKDSDGQPSLSELAFPCCGGIGTHAYHCMKEKEEGFLNRLDKLENDVENTISKLMNEAILHGNIQCEVCRKEIDHRVVITFTPCCDEMKYAHRQLLVCPECAENIGNLLDFKIRITQGMQDIEKEYADGKKDDNKE